MSFSAPRRAPGSSRDPQRYGRYNSSADRLIDGTANVAPHETELTALAADVELGELVPAGQPPSCLPDPPASPKGGSAYVLHFQNLTFSVKQKQRGGQRLMILNSISGHCVSGRLLAVMGRSGAGKTTLVRWPMFGVEALTMAGCSRPRGAQMDGIEDLRCNTAWPYMVWVALLSYLGCLEAARMKEAHCTLVGEM